MKQSNIDLRSILEGLYKTIGAKKEQTKDGILFYILVDNIKGKEGQPIRIPLIHSNPFQAISKYKKKVPSVYFMVDVDPATDRYFGDCDTKYYEEQFDENGNLEAVEYKRQGDPTNYAFTLTAEVRNDLEGIEISNYFRRKVSLPSGRFLWTNKEAEGMTALPYIDASITRSREMFDLVTNNVIITLSFTVLGYWDYREEERFELPRIDRAEIIN